MISLRSSSLDSTIPMPKTQSLFAPIDVESFLGWIGIFLMFQKAICTAVMWKQQGKQYLPFLNLKQEDYWEKTPTLFPQWVTTTPVPPAPAPAPVYLQATATPAHAIVRIQTGGSRGTATPVPLLLEPTLAYKK